MATILNASTSAGLVQTADTTGNLSLQSAGTTILALTSAGATVTGTLSATGLTTLGASAQGVQIDRLSDGTPYGLITLNGVYASTTACGMYGRGSGGDSGKLFITGIGSVVSQIAGVTVTSVSSTGLAVTGTLSATGTTTATALIPSGSSVPTNGLYLPAANNVAISTNSIQALRVNTNGTVIGKAGNGFLQLGDGSASYGCGIWFSADSSANSWLIDCYDYGASRFSMAQSTGAGVIGSTATERLYVANGGTSWTAASDETVKNITGEFVGALDQVAKSRTVRGAYKYDPDTKHSFLIAQDWQDYLPEAISLDINGKLGLSYSETIPVAFAAIKELIAKDETLEAKNEALEAKIEALEARLAALEAK